MARGRVVLDHRAPKRRRALSMPQRAAAAGQAAATSESLPNGHEIRTAE